MAADPVPYDSSCDECDLCCVLAVELVDPCWRFYWQCKCPDGTLTLQSTTGIFGAWEDWPDFEPDDSTWWLFNKGFTGGQWRLKCELQSGEIYYSNIVTTIQPASWRFCSCTEDGELKSTRVWFEVDIRYFERASYAADAVYDPVESFSTYVECPLDGGQSCESVIVWETPGPGLLWDVTALYCVPLTANGEFKASIVVERTDNQSLSGAITVEKELSTVVRGDQCYWQCFSDLAFDGSALTWPAKPGFSGGGGYGTAWKETAGSGFDYHIKKGYVIIVRVIQIETV